MLITEKQLLFLFDIAKWYVMIDRDPFPFTKETIKILIDQIYNQQSDKLIEVK